LRYTLKFAALGFFVSGRFAPKMSRIAAILPAAGLGTRMGADTPKQFLELDGTPLVIHSVRRIASCPLVTDIFVATRADVVDSLEERIRGERFMQSVRVVRGGDSRRIRFGWRSRKFRTTRRLSWFTTRSALSSPANRSLE